MGEVGLNGAIVKTDAVLPASVWANNHNLGIICPGDQGAEARWAGHNNILAPFHVVQLINHFKGTQVLPLPELTSPETTTNSNLDMADVHGQAAAKRALEIAAAGGHAMLMVGPPGSGKTMLASRLPTIMPEMTAEEMKAGFDANDGTVVKMAANSAVNGRQFLYTVKNIATNRTRCATVYAIVNGELVVGDAVTCVTVE